MLKNRHLDQILLCAIFSVCRVAGVFPRVTFAGVIEVYRTGQLSAARQRWTSAAMGFTCAARTVRAVATPEATAYAAHRAKVRASFLLFALCIPLFAHLFCSYSSILFFRISRAHRAKAHAASSGSSARDIALVASESGDVLHFYNLVFVPAIEVRRRARRRSACRLFAAFVLFERRKGRAAQRERANESERGEWAWRALSAAC